MKRTILASEPKVLPFPSAVTSDWTHSLAWRQAPEIDGSRGAFIGLVAALSFLIVVCCVAVFYLLRYHEPTEQDRAARRAARYYEHQRTREPTSSSAGGTSTTVPGSLGSLSDKMKRVWQRSTGRGEAGGRRGGRGWIRAGSNDEWASHSDHDVDERGPDPEQQRFGAGQEEEDGRLGSLPVFNKGTAARPSGRGGDSVAATAVAHGVGGAVRIVESSSSDSASGGFAVPAVPYIDPFHSKTTTMAQLGLHRSQSPLSSSSSPPSSPSPTTSSPKGSTSADDRHHRQEARVSSPISPISRDDHRYRHLSALSTSSVRTPGGSKFVEDI